jgi:hypothetical protein
LKVKTVFLSIKGKVETKAVERDGAGSGTEIPFPNSLISQEMLDRFTETLGHDAGMFNRYRPLSTETVQSINSCVTVFSNLGHFG